jgi:xenotropic and polytropic retrovirus receptor 1
MLPIQLAFFDKLNLELSKVEHFFIEREAEARARSLELREQLEELKDHRRLFHVTRLCHVMLCAADRWTFSTKDTHPEDCLPTSVPFFPFVRSNAAQRNRSRKSTHTDNEGPVESHDADTAVEPHTLRLAGGARLDPDEYLRARKQLKRAVSEHYHALEVLNNYRV